MIKNIKEFHLDIIYFAYDRRTNFVIPCCLGIYRSVLKSFQTGIALKGTKWSDLFSGTSLHFVLKHCCASKIISRVRKGFGFATLLVLRNDSRCFSELLL